MHKAKDSLGLENLSGSFLTVQSLTTEILPYFGYAHECERLMTTLRSGSRKLWISNVYHWSRLLSDVKQTVVIDEHSEEKIKYLTKHDRYAMFKFIIIAKLNGFDCLYDFTEH